TNGAFFVGVARAFDTSSFASNTNTKFRQFLFCLGNNPLEFVYCRLFQFVQCVDLFQILVGFAHYFLLKNLLNHPRWGFSCGSSSSSGSSSSEINSSMA